ncbi:DUF3179 domain-containing protein [Alteromonas sp. 5E99-2]|uniref:DUF3179 domain-containing protein n=1 Tax=Alteromonas sp. 5E99-2 TaxID=2817683 RepID=UPI001A998313|nr:DUF3179 domain-containing protein [Alteromonas sp. 5E99-2]MBO1254721.1 DUF3179 domain-containing protein [Alteromonas sp. 5E99-2]
MHHSFLKQFTTAAFLLVCSFSVLSQDKTSVFEQLIAAESKKEIDVALAEIDANWSSEFIPQSLEMLSLTRDYYTSQSLLDVLERHTKQSFGFHLNDWFFWLWNQPQNISSNYAQFKASLYVNIDPRFHRYFDQRQSQAKIRLDEIRWGGVVQDGIPPLRNPKMLNAKSATYLNDDNVVFGIEINGDARAYPKRILAWHEMFVDTVGGVDIAGVYCTLCGTVIPYKTELSGTKYTLGTSGFLYRSNKLMYDLDTQSLWNTLTGKPVVGPLVDKGIELEHLSVVTTTWGEWKRRHPDTRVLSLETGHRRDYDEGVAYQDYFSSDRLMFNTPFADKRLKNKQEILALRFPGAPNQQLAIDTEFLRKKTLYKNKIGRQKFIVLTDKSGANRVYDPKNIDFVSYDNDSTLTDNKGIKWQLDEQQLINQDTKETLDRLPYHRAFWFGWHAAFPETKLIK